MDFIQYHVDGSDRWDLYWMIRRYLAYYYLISRHSKVCNVKRYAYEIFVKEDYVENEKTYSVDFYMSKYSLPKFIKLIKEQDCRFIFIVLHLSRAGVEGHANALLIDKKLKTIERYDPSTNSKKYQEYYESLNDEIQKHFVDGTYITSFKDMSLVLCPGLQNLESKDDSQQTSSGYCEAWAIWYLDMRLSNPDLSPELLLQKSLEELNKGSLRQYIRGYANFIIDIDKKLHFSDLSSTYNILRKIRRLIKKKFVIS